MYCGKFNLYKILDSVKTSVFSLEDPTIKQTDWNYADDDKRKRKEKDWKEKRSREREE